ncbi:bifunctional phosphopantothenoylcysteine decarboxylase/phosphopantothenate--cysteine ligase CoaBC [Thermodesulfobacteriota bacterium]
MDNTKEKNRIILGVTGGIAAYKAPELARMLIKKGHDVRVVMTENAARFIAPLTFEALTKNRVISSMWDKDTNPLAHISWGQESDLVIIAPATANFIAKMANGIADDFLSTMVLASTAQVLVCPAMNSEMYINSITQDNINKLIDHGCMVMKPGEGHLACDTEGPGRLPEPVDIAEQACIMLSRQDLAGLKILVTAGPTTEDIDPVRYITNRSSGKMGYAVAKMAALRGASVKLISGPTALKPPAGTDFIVVKTAEEMKNEVIKHCRHMDIIIKAAAVSDYRPAEVSAQKIKKSDNDFSIKLTSNPDILSELGKLKEESGFILTGFAAETENILDNAREKLLKKNLDLIVVNDVTAKNAGFDTDTNQVTIISKDGGKEELPIMSKEEAADRILDRIKTIKQGES